MIKSVFYNIIRFVIIIIFITAICSILEYLVSKTYYKLQNLYIKKSNNHYDLCEKLLLINYRVYKSLKKFFVFLNPIKNYSDHYACYFDLKIFSYSFRDTFKSISIYGIILYIIKTIVINYNNVLNFIQKQKNINIIGILKIGFSILYENKWYILAFLSAVSIIYGIYKNKFTNKLIEEFQDDELKEIIELYKKVSTELIELEILLLENIKTILTEYKTDGIFMFLYTEVEKRYVFCEYDYSNNKLVVSDSYYNSGISRNVKLKDINQNLDNIKKLFDDYRESEHFYSPYAINKYFKGMNKFDVEYFVKFPYLLLSENYLNKCFDNTFNDYSEMIENESISKEYIVNALNEKVKDINFSIYCTTIKSIEKVIQIDKFNKQLQKSLSLKKYRNKFSIDSLISNIK